MRRRIALVMKYTWIMAKKHQQPEPGERRIFSNSPQSTRISPISAATSYYASAPAIAPSVAPPPSQTAESATTPDLSSDQSLPPPANARPAPNARALPISHATPDHAAPPGTHFPAMTAAAARKTTPPLLPAPKRSHPRITPVCQQLPRQHSAQLLHPPRRRWRQPDIVRPHAPVVETPNNVRPRPNDNPPPRIGTLPDPTMTF